MLKTVGDKVSPTVQIALFFVFVAVRFFYAFIFYCVVPENIHTPHGGSRNFLGVGGSKRAKFPKGRGVHKEFFFPEGLKCDQINTYVFFPIDSGNQERGNRRRIPCDIFSIIILAPDNTYSTEAHL